MQLINSDCLQALKDIPDNSIDSLVTDPPYGWKFMGKKWDYDIPSIEVWQECLRVLKPGAHALVCCGTRTQHRMAVNLEDAGFEIRDLIAWVYGSGFPKGLNIGKAIDKIQGNEKEITGKDKSMAGDFTGGEYNITKGTSEWEGWGTALKPSMELWTLCRKPLIGTVAQNVLEYGTGGINIDGCRVPAEEGFADWVSKTANPNGTNKGIGRYGDGFQGIGKTFDNYKPKSDARFPANLIHDGSDEVVGLFPESNGCQPHNIKSTVDKYDGWGSITKKSGELIGYEGGGSAARFFYCAKASKSERNMGCEGLEEVMKKGNGSHNGRVDTDPVSARFQTMTKNHHPTVKPISLMRYLCRLITPPRGMVLDPYMGSGSTGIACKLEGFDFIGIEIDPEYIKIAEARINSVKQAVLV